MTKTTDQLPSTWLPAQISHVAAINPRLDKADIPDDLEVSFVPMPAVQELTGRMDVTTSRPSADVKKGYTPFLEGDVLFAKITPCMENGKMAVVPALKNGYGFGSTEFHVLRPYSGIDAKYLYYFVSSQGFRADAEHNMTGAVGQRRVPTLYLSERCMPVAPSAEQRRIVAKIEELFSELDKGIESLTAAGEQLKAYRQSVLKHAFEGKLTKGWRSLHPEQALTAAERLACIRTATKARFDKSVRAWEANGKKGSKPPSPASDGERELADFGSLPPLPRGWAYIPFRELAYSIRNGISKKPNETGPLRIFRISAVRPMEFDMADFRHIDNDPEFYSYRLQRGDIVFTRYNGSRNYVGVAALYRSDEEFVYPDKLIRCDVRLPPIDEGYIEKAVNCGASRTFIESRIRTTAGQAGISGADLKAMPVPICSVEEQRAINQLVEGQLAGVVRLEAEVQSRLIQAEALRQSILKKAFSGQLVPQDRKDEPASVLLERVRAERDGAPSQKSRNRRNGQKNTNGHGKKRAA
jgi:type I restriction enzyme, S subunit